MNATEKRYGTTLRIYDNGGKTCDRFTIIPPRWARDEVEESISRYRGVRTFSAIASSERPFHPQGFGQHVSAVPGPHLGRRIRWDALPLGVQRFARQSFPEYAPRDPDAIDFDTIAKHFCIAAVWADCEEGTHPRVTKEALADARDFAVLFHAAAGVLVCNALQADGYGSHPDAGSPAAAFGHDLFLTCAGHGVGFSDRDELGETGEALAEYIRSEWRRWSVETYFYRGWLYFLMSGEGAK